MKTTAFNPGITGNRLHAEFRIFHEVVANHGTFAVLRDYIHPDMFKNAMVKTVMEQYFAAWELFQSGGSFTMFPTEDDILILVKEKGWAKEFAKVMAEYSFRPETVLLVSLHLIEINVRETCMVFLNQVRVHGHPLTESLKKCDDWSIDTFSIVQDLQRDMVLVGRQDVATKFQRILDRLKQRSEDIRKHQTAKDLINSLIRIMNTDPDVLKPHADIIQKMLSSQSLAA